MEAGHGAEEQMARHARRAERLQRELDAARETEAAVAAALERARRQERAWAAGAEGERMVAESLDVLRRYGWTFLHDVAWPGRQRANIDHIAIGPGGVVVIDAKNWTGTITAGSGTLRQNGYGRERELEGVSAATADVTALLDPMHRSATVGMLCLAGQDHEPTATSSGVPVVGRHQLAEALLRLPPRLTPYEVADIGRFLARELGDDRPPARPRSTGGRRRSAAGTGQWSMPYGPLVDPSPRPIRSPRPGRALSSARGRRGRSRARKAGGGAGAAFVKLALILVGLGLLMANLESLSAAYVRLFLPDAVTSGPEVPVPPSAPVPPDPVAPPAEPPAEPEAATIVP